MTPIQLSSQLRHIAAKISNSKSPQKNLVIKDLKELISKISSDKDQPDKDQPEIPLCKKCKQPLSESDQILFESGGAPSGSWPNYCEDCAEELELEDSIP